MKPIITIMIIITALSLLMAREMREPDYVLDRSFFTEFSRTNPILRDSFFNEKLQSIITGTGEIVQVQKSGRYRREHLLILKENKTGPMNLDFTYHLYFSGKDFLDIIQKGELFEFRGQVISYAPANIERDRYILDILLEDGAMIIE